MLGAEMNEDIAAVDIMSAFRRPSLIINVIVTCVVGTGLYYALVGRIDRQEIINAAQEKEIADFRQERKENMARYDMRISDVDRKADAKLEVIQRDVAELKGLQREMNANLNWIIQMQQQRQPNARPLQ